MWADLWNARLSRSPRRRHVERECQPGSEAAEHACHTAVDCRVSSGMSRFGQPERVRSHHRWHEHTRRDFCPGRQQAQRELREVASEQQNDQIFGKAESLTIVTTTPIHLPPRSALSPSERSTNFPPQGKNGAHYVRILQMISGISRISLTAKHHLMSGKR